MCYVYPDMFSGGAQQAMECAVTALKGPGTDAPIRQHSWQVVKVRVCIYKCMCACTSACVHVHSCTSFYARGQMNVKFQHSNIL